MQVFFKKIVLNFVIRALNFLLLFGFGNLFFKILTTYNLASSTFFKGFQCVAGCATAFNERVRSQLLPAIV